MDLRHKISNCYTVTFTLLLFFLVSLCSFETKAASKRETVHTVIIDAGHGGHDHGAIDNNVREKDINLGVAKKLASKLKKLKNLNVVMTRDDDTFISLQERADIANRNKGDLFISIHTNSVDKSNPNRSKVSGTSVYALGPQKDANNLKVAQRENSVIELEDNYHQKYSGFDPSRDESYIIFEMAQKKTLGQSLKFADKAQKELVKTANRGDRGVRQAGFWVLWATSMPSVLVELDFICNPNEAKFISSDNGQDKLAEALCNAVQQFFAGNSGIVTVNESRSNQIVNEDKSELSASKSEVDKNIINNDSEEINTLKSVSESKPKVRNEHNGNPSKRINGPRKRRSESSRRLSEAKSFETDEIEIKEELSYIAVRENTKETISEDIILSDNSDKAQGKKKKEKKKKESKTSLNQKRGENKSKDKNTVNRGKKTYIVKNPVTSKEADQKRIMKDNPSVTTEMKSKRPIMPVPSTSEKMVYKILLLSSSTELNPSDPAFAGIVPTGMYKENNLFKYTYGNSTNRNEIESELLKVKSILPEAVIVVRSE